MLFKKINLNFVHSQLFIIFSMFLLYPLISIRYFIFIPYTPWNFLITLIFEGLTTVITKVNVIINNLPTALVFLLFFDRIPILIITVYTVEYTTLMEVSKMSIVNITTSITKIFCKVFYNCYLM